MKTTHFPHSQSEEENQTVSGATSASPGTSTDSDTLDCHSPVFSTLRISEDPEDGQQQSCNELAECQPEWELEREEMEITNWNGIGNGNEPLGIGGNGIEKDIPAHL